MTMRLQLDQSFFPQKIAHANAPILARLCSGLPNFISILLTYFTIQPNLTSPKVLLWRHDPCHNDILHTGLDCDTRHQYTKTFSMPLCWSSHSIIVMLDQYRGRRRFWTRSCHQKLYLLVSPCRFLLIVDKSKGLFSRRHESCFKRP